ncbi:hypothetical protein [Mycolicibacterium gilvum]|uniref:Uncharacterized protein n=1 Tax=Mycolicibacterium gilvum TaxID=1804 RepID=A0A378SNW5_9MYCO|nr:hypothetical protein [Mycolicibacterium gilvum]MCV7055506.1 hypothetical protein [Mycolicibacterium gilvum]STZ43554.1 Uncharacterised protein [Mycolicibacterium gilvum]
MTDNTPETPDTTTPEESTPEGTDTETATEEPDQDSTDATPDAVKEARKYRRRAQTAEAERDTLKARLEILQRGEVERLVADRLADPADVWRDGATLDTLLDDDGNIDPKRVDELTKGLLAAHAHWGITRHKPAGFQSGAAAQTFPRRDSFTAAFAPKER